MTQQDINNKVLQIMSGGKIAPQGRISVNRRSVKHKNISRDMKMLFLTSNKLLMWLQQTTPAKSEIILNLSLNEVTPFDW